jgi:hypothetical protein
MEFKDYLNKIQKYLLYSTYLIALIYILSYFLEIFVIKLLMSILISIPTIFFSMFFYNTYRFERESGKSDKIILKNSFLIFILLIILSIISPIVFYTIILRESLNIIFFYLYVFIVFLIIILFFIYYLFIKRYKYFFEYHIKEKLDINNYLRIKPFFLFSAYLFFFSLLIIIFAFILSNPRLSISNSYAENFINIFIIFYVLSSLSLFYTIKYLKNG